MIVVNFKNYKIGRDVLDLVRTIDIYCNKAVIAVPFADIKDIVKNTTLPVYAQHVDYFEQGRGTGYIIPEALAEAGAKGSLLNHSEHKVSFKAIQKTIERCHPLGLKLIVCVSKINAIKKVIKLKPYAVAFEDPSLIATGKSITQHKSPDIREFVSILKETNIIPLCGAGITTPEDVKRAVELGCKGVLVASAVANAQHPEKFLKEAAKLF